MNPAPYRLLRPGQEPEDVPSLQALRLRCQQLREAGEAFTCQRHTRAGYHPHRPPRERGACPPRSEDT